MGLNSTPKLSANGYLVRVVDIRPSVYSPNAPLYVSDTRRRSLAFFILMLILSVIVVFGAYASPPTDLSQYYVVFIFPVLAVIGAYGYMKATRVELHENFVRIFGRRGGPNRDLPYSELTLGPLISAGGGYSFKIYSKQSPKALCAVRNVRLENMDTTLYSFIQARGNPVTPSTTIPIMKNPVPRSFWKRHPFMVTALVVLVVMMAGSLFFWSVSGPRGTPPVDVDIGIGFFLGGIFALIGLNVARNIVVRRQTER